ncbi:FAD/NAD(P)-binding protein [Natrialba sp. PRR66]|uniref:FAD/NAD(P)-binding protein n=1 Tax=Natrialba sp. PRR66 TaxID=3098146 RepID=UPI002B1CE944|nr:FAD/NAD(P)-binding protein [Natrialba sp. PRR66]
MKSTPSRDQFACVIVGGGIHGTYLAQRLLEETSLDRTNIAIVDPHQQLLASFREKARACGMESLRSSFVHHLGTEPFGLEHFAEGTDREDELVPTIDHPPRPSLDLFLDYAEYVIEKNSLEALHIQSTVEAIFEQGDGPRFRLETTAGLIETHNCVLAIGHGGRYRWPDWAVDVDGVEHVWDGFDQDTTVDHTIVVGGGSTAGHLACTLSETESVTMITRHPLEWEVLEADPPWINWSHLERELHVHPPGSSERLSVIRDARYTATVPTYLSQEFETKLEEGSLALEQGEIWTARSDNGSVQLFQEDGTQTVTDRIVLATGFEPVFRHPFIERLASEIGLDRGYRGMPILDDQTLEWQRIDGSQTSLYVSGALALGTIGPYAPNIPGARRAADRITKAIS